MQTYTLCQREIVACKKWGAHIYQDMPTVRLQMVCGLIVMTMLVAATDILDLPPGQPLLEQEMEDNFVRQLQIILLGAGQWKEKAGAQS